MVFSDAIVTIGQDMNLEGSLCDVDYLSGIPRPDGDMSEGWEPDEENSTEMLLMIVAMCRNMATKISDPEIRNFLDQISEKNFGNMKLAGETRKLLCEAADTVSFGGSRVDYDDANAFGDIIILLDFLFLSGISKSDSTKEEIAEIFWDAMGPFPDRDITQKLLSDLRK